MRALGQQQVQQKLKTDEKGSFYSKNLNTLKVTDAQQTIKLDLANQAAGIYSLQVISQDKVYTTNIVLQR